MNRQYQIFTLNYFFTLKMWRIFVMYLKRYFFTAQKGCSGRALSSLTNWFFTLEWLSCLSKVVTPHEAGATKTVERKQSLDILHYMT